MWLRATDDPAAEIEESASSLWESTLDFVPRIGVAAVIVAAGWAASRGLRWLLHRYLRRRQTPSFATVMSKIGGWIFLTVVVLIAMAITFPSVRPVDLLAGLGFFSIAVGFAFQDILENTLSGMLLLFRQPFRSGDQIEVMGQSGTVEGITIRETRIIRYDGELVVIPNRDVYKNEIVVHTYRDDHRQEFVVGIAYENDAEEATTAIIAALRSVDGVRLDPPPMALVENLNVSTVDIVAMFWTSARRFDSLLVKDAAIKAVKRRLDDAGIEMPADIVALQATPSFKAALQNEADVTPAGSIRT
ncbi:small-conductance mechanosensitive channel [Ilumatobacter fluminis]|uniref:Small-conductance mechanosensitive channel n=1 Tax=Ilumatobacter fluminis TaxID=467091 RepID=A0A4R7HW61_9ACTN|nr:mechanosensitive ion channel family protein [Ilumatobacter fluminis]TDT15292.1 small-conductance mechanosensitive channel [Ilumatobacter fluminis]